VAIAPSGKIFASSSLDCNISIWDLETYEQLKKIESGPLESWTVQFTRDSQHILTGNADGKVEMFSVETGKKEKSLETKQKMSLSIATSPDGKYGQFAISNYS
jgi:WD repeat-containing protein 61